MNQLLKRHTEVLNNKMVEKAHICSFPKIPMKHRNTDSYIRLHLLFCLPETEITLYVCLPYNWYPPLYICIHMHIRIMHKKAEKKVVKEPAEIYNFFGLTAALTY